jgi:GNAT superfamily N-acetyltransferase
MNNGQQPDTVMVCQLSQERWPDLEKLFGPNGAVAGCWCMWFRQTAAEFDARHGEENRQSLKAIVDAGQVPGLLAYVDGQPVGWCAVAPRSEFGRVQRSRILHAPGNEAAWAVVCFFIERRHRRAGIGAALLRAAVDYAVARGARTVEGYPIDARDGHVSSGSAFTGLASMFLAAGFEEVARHSPGRPIMRYAAS